MGFDLSLILCSLLPSFTTGSEEIARRLVPKNRPNATKAPIGKGMVKCHIYVCNSCPLAILDYLYGR